jgi:hypothetical protein
MERIRYVLVEGREILTIDYSGLKEEQMIHLASQAIEVIVKSKGQLLVLTNFENTYATPRYVRFMENGSKEVIPFIDRNAMVGVSKVKVMILKGFNLLMGTDWKAFSTEKEALEYLLQTKIENEVPCIF